MAKFITNSTGTKVVRKEKIVSMEITHNPAVGETPEHYSIDILFPELGTHVWSFDTDTTLEGIQDKGASMLEQLETE